MTETCYLNDPETLSFDATVIHTMHDSHGFWVALDRTYFYPEGGGQPADTGNINLIPVTDVQMIEGVPMHRLVEPLDMGTLVHCQINGDRRLDLMQQHTGQHLLSHGLEFLYDCETVGFHLTDTNLTVDTDKKLSQEDLEQLEDYINSLIRQNLKVKIHYPTPEALMQMPLRKQPKVTQDVRVVEIENQDFSPCGGTHVSSTGMIQLIKIRRFETYKSGLRIEFVCGKRALADYRDKTVIIQQLMGALSASKETLLDSVYRIKAETEAQSKELLVLRENALLIALNEALQNRQSTAYGDFVLYSAQALDSQLFKKAAPILTSQIQGVCLITNTTADSYQIILAQSSDKPIDLQALFSTLKTSFNIKGGGSPTAVQGGGPIDELDALLSHLLKTLNS